jgi:hypothetical protein
MCDSDIPENRFFNISHNFCNLDPHIFSIFGISRAQNPVFNIFQHFTRFLAFPHFPEPDTGSLIYPVPYIPEQVSPMLSNEPLENSKRFYFSNYNLNLSLTYIFCPGHVSHFSSFLHWPLTLIGTWRTFSHTLFCFRGHDCQMVFKAKKCFLTKVIKKTSSTVHLNLTSLMSDSTIRGSKLLIRI